MKTFSRTLYQNEYHCYAFWSHEDNMIKVESYIKVMVHFDFKEGLRFSVSVPNFACCMNNPFKALFRVLEHESIGMMKYNHLKWEIRSKELDRKLG